MMLLLSVVAAASVDASVDAAVAVAADAIVCCFVVVVTAANVADEGIDHKSSPSSSPRQ